VEPKELCNKYLGELNVNVCSYFGEECQGHKKQTCGYWDKKCKCPQEEMTTEKLAVKMDLKEIFAMHIAVQIKIAYEMGLPEDEIRIVLEEAVENVTCN
jgi:hypothetical protein